MIYIRDIREKKVGEKVKTKAAVPKGKPRQPVLKKPLRLGKLAAIKMRKQAQAQGSEQREAPQVYAADQVQYGVERTIAAAGAKPAKIRYAVKKRRQAVKEKQAHRAKENIYSDSGEESQSSQVPVENDDFPMEPKGEKPSAKSEGKINPSINQKGPQLRKGGRPRSIKEHVKGNVIPKEKPAGSQLFVRTKQAAGRVVKPVPDPIKAGKPAKLIPPGGRRITHRVRWQMRRHSQRQLVQGAKKVAKVTAVFAKKAAVVAAKTASSLISATAGLIGGGVLLMVVCVIILVAEIAASPFGIFFSGEQQPGAITPREAVAQINQEYEDRLEELKRGDYDRIEQTGGPPPWRDVLSIFACKTAGADDGMDVTAFDPDRMARLQSVFWDMTAITTWVETITRPAEDEDAEPLPEHILHIKITAKSVTEMAVAYSFSAHQQTQLAELLAEDNRPLWNELLYGISGAGSGEIVAVALSQVGNAGGRPYWSWYGFGGRVEWCACFVSWCADQCGYIQSGEMPKFAACSAGIAWFRNRGQWQDRGYTPAPGDVIFFDWGPDGAADHVGLVERVENGRIYTIEGNSNDRVRQCSYPLGSVNIFGYGITI